MSLTGDERGETSVVRRLVAKGHCKNTETLHLFFNLYSPSLGLSFLNIGSGTGYFSCLAGYILQNHGINHGVELHEDLVRFAKGRVEEYLQFCPAIAHDICMPKFVAGNCFRLDPSGCNYDRVYCGAACPPNKVPLILALTKIGGFAIIPCRNKVWSVQF